MSKIKSLIAASMMSWLAGAGHAATIGTSANAYSLGNDGTSLVTLSARGATGSNAVTLSFEDGANISLDGIAYRPNTKELYGYDDETDTVFVINTATGAAKTVVTNAGITNDNDLGFDFNNQIDAARIVTGQGENVVFFVNVSNRPTAPELVKFTDLAYAASDVNVGEIPNVVMNAYTNAVPNATSTFQYVIDTRLDTLASLANNSGVLSTIGSLFLDGAEFDATEFGGFDILSFKEGNNTAFALLQDFATNVQSIFEVPLMADAFGRINLSRIASATTEYGTLNGFAVAPVPLPAAGLLLVGGLGGIAALRRRRKNRTA